VATPLDPPIGVPLFDPATGSIAEVWRIYFRRMGATFGVLPPADAPYWVSTANATLTAEQNLGLLAAGYLKIAVALGIATPSTVALIPATDLSGIVPSANLGAGLADATTVLYGDSVYRVPGGGPGSIGPTGPMGLPGFDGLDGEDGDRGADGPRGATGANGSNGAAGLNGAPGPPGLDADDPEPTYMIPAASVGLTLDQTLACASFRM